jgi:NAD(P)-dependent dehydrogenase (short-subunit alcohol dehydrogenase family)
MEQSKHATKSTIGGVNGLRSSFITARAAARQMIEQGSGVILHLNSASGAGAMPGMGSTGPADAASESFMRVPNRFQARVHARHHDRRRLGCASRCPAGSEPACASSSTLRS